MKNTHTLLLSISDIDDSLHSLTTEKERIDKERATETARLNERRKLLAAAEERHKKSSAEQESKEAELKKEEAHIIGRRKQLADMGGAKMAKVLEREVDIAARSLVQLEEVVLKTMEASELATAELTKQKAEFESLQKDIETKLPAIEERHADIVRQIGELSTERLKVLEGLEVTARKLYDKIIARYPTGAVAVAKAGICGECQRSLPPQTYNQVKTFAVIAQCPGCNRILVVRDEESV